MSPHALVTGGTGFLGRALITELLDGGWSVTAPHRPSSSAQQLAALRSAGAETVPFQTPSEFRSRVATSAPDAVFHLATHYVRDHSRSDIPLLMSANIELGTALLDEVASSQARVVTALSFFQFRGGLPATNSLYSATKQAFTDITAFYREQRGVDAREAVLFDTYGPGDTRDKLVPALIAAVRAGAPIALGPQRQVIDLLHARDAARGLLAIAAASPSPARSALRADAVIEIAELVAAIERASRSRLRVTFADDRPPNDLPVTSGDWPRPEGWSPQVALDTGLSELLG